MKKLSNYIKENKEELGQGFINSTQNVSKYLELTRKNGINKTKAFKRLFTKYIASY